MVLGSCCLVELAAVRFIRVRQTVLLKPSPRGGVREVWDDHFFTCPVATRTLVTPLCLVCLCLCVHVCLTVFSLTAPPANIASMHPIPSRVSGRSSPGPAVARRRRSDGRPDVRCEGSSGWNRAGSLFFGLRPTLQAQLRNAPNSAFLRAPVSVSLGRSFSGWSGCRPAVWGGEMIENMIGRSC